MQTATSSVIGYAHVSRNPSILGGVPIVEGTRTPVRSIATYFNMGMTVDEILLTLPYLSFSQVFSALSFYFDHKTEVDANIAENNDIGHWEAMSNSAIRPS